MTKLDRAAVQGSWTRPKKAITARFLSPLLKTSSWETVRAPDPGDTRKAEMNSPVSCSSSLEFFKRNVSINTVAAFMRTTGSSSVLFRRERVQLQQATSSKTLAVYVTRIDADDKGDRLWTVDLDTEACLGFRA